MKTFLLVCMLTLLASEAPAAPEKSAGPPSVDTQLAVIAQGVGEIKDKLADLASDVRELRAEVSRKADREDVEEIDDRVARDGIAIASMNTEVDGLKKKIDSISGKGFDFMSGLASAVVGAAAAFLLGMLAPRK